jgi:hypothetical protein
MSIENNCLHKYCITSNVHVWAICSYCLPLFVKQVSFVLHKQCNWWQMKKNFVTCMCDYRRGLDWWMNLLTTYTDDSELPAITAPPLISIIHKSPQHPLSLFPACCIFTSRSLATASNSVESSVSRAQILRSQPPVQNSLSSLSQVKVKVTLRLTVSQSVNLGVEPHLRLMTRYLFLSWQLRYCFLWGALSDERLGLYFIYATGLCQRSLSQVRVPWYSRPYFTVSDLRLPFSSPPTTRRLYKKIHSVDHPH